jgi:hypothetical protein
MPQAYRRLARPRLEILEDRLAPAAFHVDHLADDGVGSEDTGSLRYCIDQANAAPEASTIDFQVQGTFHLTATLHIARSVTITGAGGVEQGLVTIRGDLGSPDAFRLFEILGTDGSPITVTLKQLALTLGDAGTGDGGAVESRYADLTLDACDIDDNAATNGAGVDVRDGSLRVLRSFIFRNYATADGGGINVSQGTVTIDDSTIHANHADGPGSYGGGVYAGTSSSVSVSGGVIRGNHASVGGGIAAYQASVSVSHADLNQNVASVGDGGGIYADDPGTVTIFDSTFDSGSAARDGAGLFIRGGAADTSVTLTNSTFAGNIAGRNAGALAIDAIGGNIAVDLEACTVAYNGGGHDAAAWGVYASSSGDGSTAIAYRNTLFARNGFGYGIPDLAVSDPLADRLVSLGHNLSDDGTGIVPGVGGDIQASPNLGPIDDFGDSFEDNYYSPVHTVPLLAGPGSTGGVLLPDAYADERGVERPADPSIGASQTSTAISLVNDESSAQAYGDFSKPIALRITDNDHPLLREIVEFTVTSGSATFGGATSITAEVDATGMASAMLTTGPFDGPVTVAARVIGNANPGIYYATGVQTFAFHLTVTPVFNPVPGNVVLTTSKSSVVEGEAFALSGSFDDPAIVEPPNLIYEPHTVRITWGDGKSETILLARQVYTFRATHAYTSGPPASSYAMFPITAVVEDSAGQTGEGSAPIEVADVPPRLVIDETDQFFNTASTFFRSGSFVDPGDSSFALTVDYGDGTGVRPLAYDPATRSFALSHAYSVEGSYSVIITVQDGRGGDDIASFGVDLLLPGVPTDTAIKAKARPGGTVTATEPGVTATLFHAAGPGVGRLDASLLLAVVPPGVATGLDASITVGGKVVSTAYDVRTLNIGDLDRATVVFHYESDTDDPPSFTYFDRAGGRQVPVDPRFYVLDANARTIALTLDSRSTPRLRDLTGTVFTIAVTLAIPAPAAPAPQLLPLVLIGVMPGPGGVAPDIPPAEVTSGGGAVSAALQIVGRASAIAVADAVFSTGVVVAPPGVTQAMLSIASALVELPAVSEDLITLPGAILTPGSAEMPYVAEPPTPVEETAPPSEEASEEVAAREEVFARLAGRPLEVSPADAESSWPGITLAAVAILAGPPVASSRRDDASRSIAA